MSKTELNNLEGVEDGQIIETITKPSEGTEEITVANIKVYSEYLEIEYIQNIKNIETIITYTTIAETEEEQILNLVNTKEIEIIRSEILTEITALKTKVSYEELENITDEEAKIQIDVEKNTEIKERETKAEIGVNNEELSTTLENNVQFTLTLFSENNMYDLWANPKFIIELPECIETLQTISKEEITLLNNKAVNELGEQEDIFTNIEINQKEEESKKYIEISLTGEQKKHNEATINNVQVVIPVKIKTSKLLPTTNTQINLYYSNENKTTYNKESTNLANYGEYNKEISFIAATGMLTKTTVMVDGESIENYRGEENKLLISSNANTTGEVRVIAVNNTNRNLTDVKIIGTSQALGGEIIINNATTYYSAEEAPELNSTNWEETYTAGAKSYLIEIGNLNQGETIEYNYNLSIPKVEEDTIYEEGYTILSGTETLANEKTNIEQRTVKLDVALETSVGNNAIYTGQEFSYKITITNRGETTAEEINIKDTLPTNITLVNSEDETTWENITLEPEESITKRIKVKANDVISDAEIENKIEVSAKYLEENIIKTIKNNIKTSEIETNIEARIEKNSSIQEIAEVGSNVEYNVSLINKSANTKNVNVIVEIPDIFRQETIEGKVYSKEEDSIFWYPEETTATIEGNKVTISVALEANEEKFVKVKGVIAKYITEEIVATATIKDGEDQIVLENIEKAIAPAELKVEYATYKGTENVLSQNIEMLEEDELVYEVKVTNLGPSKEYISILGDIKEELQVKSIQYTSPENSMLLEENISNLFEMSEETLNANEMITIRVTVKLLQELTETTTLSGLFEIKGEYIEEPLKIEMNNLVEIETNNPDDPENPDDPDNPDNPDVPDEPEEKKYSLSGIAWLDENENGAREEEEELLNGIVVKLFSNNNNLEQEVKTNKKGKYSFKDIKEGEYIVVFEYNKNEYKLTAPKQEGILESLNSDAYESTLAGKNIVKTDKLTITKNINNIDIGLVRKGIFDLSIQKQINKITVKNEEETKIIEYNNSDFAKVEIPAKNYIGTDLIIEYNITIANNGNVEGYVYSLKDILPKGTEFVSELNPDWYEEGGNLYSVALTQEKIIPEETKTLKVILTKHIDTDEAENIINKAEIGETFNEELLKEKDLNNNVSQAEILVAVKTGQAKTYVIVAIIALTIIVVGAYVIKKKVLE